MADEPAPPPAAPPASAPPDFAFLIASAVALVAAAVLVRNLLPAKRDLAETLRREESLRKELEDLAEEKARLERREKALEDDPVAIERDLRRQTGMTRPGEWIVR